MREFIRIIESLDDDERYARLPSSSVLKALRPEFVKAAQAVYDGWDQSDPDNDELNGGGICHLIADEIVDVLNGSSVPCTSVSDTHEVHVYVVAQCRDGVFLIDIPHRLYERGGGYTWTKIAGVTFEPDDVVIRQLDSRPSRMSQYVEFWEEE